MGLSHHSGPARTCQVGTALFIADDDPLFRAAMRGAAADAVANLNVASGGFSANGTALLDCTASDSTSTCCQ